MADDEIRLETSMDPELESALARLEHRINSVEGSLGDLRREGKKAGDGVAEGMGKATRATDETRRASERARPAVRKMGNEAAKAGAKAGVGAAGLNRFARSANRSAVASLRLGGILTAYKWAGIATGFFALAGGVSALAAGAAIAIGGLAPLYGMLAAYPTLLLTVRMAILAVKLALKQIEQPLTRIKNQFVELGPTIAGGGLRSGLDAFADSVGGLAAVTGQGLRGLGAEIGRAARYTGQLVSNRTFLRDVSDVFFGMRPILMNLLSTLFHLAQALIYLVKASLPMVDQLTDSWRRAAYRLRVWTENSMRSGMLTARLNRIYRNFTRAVQVLADVFVGLFNIIRIGAGYSAEMGRSVEQNAAAFRAWTESVQGQERISRYFQDSLPALREMGRLLANVLSGLGSLGANQNVAPLIAQINNELGPAIARLMNNFAGQGGLGPAIISAAAALADLFAAMDFSALVLFAEAVAQLARGILWIGENVPGGQMAITALLSAFLGFKLLAPVFALIGSGAKAFKWMQGALDLKKSSSTSQKFIAGILVPTLRTLAKTLGGLVVRAITAVGLALKAAFVTSPVGWVILAIAALVAGIIWLWNNCEWFRDAVIAVWEWIRDAALAAWEWIKDAASSVLDAIVDAALWVRDRAVAVWQWIGDAAVAVWDAISSAFKAAVDFIVMVAMWIWDHGLKQTLGFIVEAFRIQFNIIKFIVQTVVFFIIAIITTIALAAEWVWRKISESAEWVWGKVAGAATWVWESVLEPIIDALETAWNAVTSALATAWRETTDALAAAWNWFWETFLHPAILIVQMMWQSANNVISTAWKATTDALAAAWNWLWTTVISPIINLVVGAWNGLTEAVSSAWNWASGHVTNAWNGIRDAANLVMSNIRGGWSAFTGWLGRVFEPIGTGISKVWEGISTAATKAADVVKGAWNAVVDAIKAVWNFIAEAWNAIPSITVPDWVPMIGGSTFSLPKLPVLYAGGPTPGGPALVGEHGPEMLVRSGRVVGMLGARGPEVVPSLPRGGYVVPNLATMTAGMAKPLPASVAAAVTRSNPDYAARGAAHDSGLRSAVRELTAAVRSNRPLTVHGNENTRAAVLDALHTYDREQRARGAYDYVAGEG